jgi:hypothetical protein
MVRSAISLFFFVVSGGRIVCVASSRLLDSGGCRTHRADRTRSSRQRALSLSPSAATGQSPARRPRYYLTSSQLLTARIGPDAQTVPLRLSGDRLPPPCQIRLINATAAQVNLERQPRAQACTCRRMPTMRIETAPLATTATPETSCYICTKRARKRKITPRYFRSCMLEAGNRTPPTASPEHLGAGGTSKGTVTAQICVGIERGKSRPWACTT